MCWTSLGWVEECLRVNPREVSLWPAPKGGGEHRAEPRRAPHSTKRSAITPTDPQRQPEPIPLLEFKSKCQQVQAG